MMCMFQYVITSLHLLLNSCNATLEFQEFVYYDMHVNMLSSHYISYWILVMQQEAILQQGFTTSN